MVLKKIITETNVCSDHYEASYLDCYSSSECMKEINREKFRRKDTHSHNNTLCEHDEDIGILNYNEKRGRNATRCRCKC